MGLPMIHRIGVLDTTGWVNEWTTPVAAQASGLKVGASPKRPQDICSVVVSVHRVPKRYGTEARSHGQLHQTPRPSLKLSSAFRSSDAFPTP